MVAFYCLYPVFKKKGFVFIVFMLFYFYFFLLVTMEMPLKCIQVAFKSPPKGVKNVSDEDEERRCCHDRPLPSIYYPHLSFCE